jgi:hypothetical protein
MMMRLSGSFSSTRPRRSFFSSAFQEGSTSKLKGAIVSQSIVRASKGQIAVAAED